jgi:hypothetical protein
MQSTRWDNGLTRDAARAAAIAAKHFVPATDVALTTIVERIKRSAAYAEKRENSATHGGVFLFIR